jgi:hypothetical protein
LIEDGDFDIPSAYMTEEEGERLAGYAGQKPAWSQAERIPAGLQRSPQGSRFRPQGGTDGSRGRQAGHAGCPGQRCRCGDPAAAG